VPRLFLQLINLSQQQNASLPQYFHLAFGGHALRLLIQSDSVGYALSGLTRFHQRSDIRIDLGDFFPQ